ncbi:type IV pilus modification protein PilV [Parahaliea sp. F7430]|uniref:Type IV pilus modification protein PilV n=1 Tax=Sediminihaliea albiluteola TaxID=2758564 RepID=A0A7W2TYH5_9GAMM|nr:type IV pilus modification protein PilV [Sediminihaliea albiluteola]MBA6414310.1 type IV pilus modification protein PilV [Sediminihaliea albiluteola]
MNRRIHSASCYKAKGQRAVGLIEVLIAMLVLALGLLGLMRMQLAAKQAAFEAAQRTVATNLARDLLERMRSNPTQLDAYSVSELGTTSTLSAAVNCAQQSCAADQLARYDLYDWHQALLGRTAEFKLGGAAFNSAGLVEPRACVNHSAGEVSVAIAWRGTELITAANSSDDSYASDCGTNQGLYGDADRQRRLLVLNTYIGKP